MFHFFPTHPNPLRSKCVWQHPATLSTFLFYPAQLKSHLSRSKELVRFSSPMMTQKPFLERTTLCAWHVDFPYCALPAFQPEYITGAWLPRTRHTSCCQDRREREGAWQTNSTALCPEQLSSKESESAATTHSSK